MAQVGSDQKLLASNGCSLTSVGCVGDFSAFPPRQVSTLQEPLARLALIGTLVGGPSSCWGWSGHRSGRSPLPGGPLPWAATELLTLLVPCSVARDGAATQAACGLPVASGSAKVRWTNMMLELRDLGNYWHLVLNFYKGREICGGTLTFSHNRKGSCVSKRQKIRQPRWQEW